MIKTNIFIISHQLIMNFGFSILKEKNGKLSKTKAEYQCLGQLSMIIKVEGFTWLEASTKMEVKVIKLFGFIGRKDGGKYL